MRLIIWTMMAVLAVSGGGTVAAQDVEGSRKEAERIMASFAKCEIAGKKGRAAALAFTREVAGTPSTYRERLIKSSCLTIPGAKLRLQPELFRMALFPALYVRAYGQGPVRDVASVPPLDYAAEFDGMPQPDVLALRSFGDCVARNNPHGAHDLLMAGLYADSEQQALSALEPALGTCVGAGRKLHFSRSVLRGAIGEAMYKLSVAADAAKAG